MENSNEKILQKIYWRCRRSAIKGEDIPLFICEVLYIVYFIRKNKGNIDIKSFKNIFELVNQLAENNECKNNLGKHKLLVDIQNDISKFKFIELEYGSLFAILDTIDNNSICEIMKSDLTDMFDISYISKGNFSTTQDISSLVNQLLNITENDSVLDICSGIGNFLTNVVLNDKYRLVFGLDINAQSSLISRIRLSILIDQENIIITDDALTHEYKCKFNKIFCNYPFGLIIDNYKLGEIKSRKNLLYSWNEYPTRWTDWLFVNTALSLLESDGKAILIMPDGPLFKTADINYKNDLLKDGMIEAIIKLPQHILSFSSISVNIVILSKKNNQQIKFVDATNEFEKGNHRNKLLVNNILELINSNSSDKVKVISCSDILKNDSILTVDNYVGQKEVVYHNPHKLSEYIIDRFRGYQMTSSQQKSLENPNGEYEILTISDIENGNISDNLTRINSDDNKFDRYLIKNGDIIISAKGTRIKIAVAEIGNRKIIANGNLIVLRINQDKLNPYYLEMFLNSQDGQTILKKIQTGTVIISINPSKLESITISTLPFDEQNIIASKYKAKQKQIELAKNHVKKLENELDNFFEDEVEVLFK